MRPAGPGSPEHAGEVRVVEGDHLRAVAPPCGARQILPLCSCEVVRGEAQPQVPVHVRALVLLGLHGVEELLELRHVGLRHLRLHPAVRQIREACVADHVARVACDHQAAGVPLVRGQGQLRGEALGLHQRLVVDHDELAPGRSSGPLSGAAHTCSLLQPAQFFVRKRSSEKSEVLVTVSVLEAKSCGAETVPELVTSPHTTLPVDTPPLVAVKVRSRLSQSSGPAEAAPVIVSVAPVSAPVAAKLAAVAAPEAVSVPVGHVAHRGEVAGVGRVVDGECAAGDSCGGAQQAHAGRAADAQRAA